MAFFSQELAAIAENFRKSSKGLQYDAGHPGIGTFAYKSFLLVDVPL
ncbi:MAG: hypothetical protein ISN28_03550 [Ectothiorhodospiraceae bacterium AqS1]|nr:hypothetical protein [Ectothiorhodospiraceae bacterium AqS1]